MKRIRWGILICLVTAGALLAQEVPDPVQQSDDEAFFLFGIGEYRHLGESLYLGALYVPLLDVRIRPESPKYMEMRITTETLSARRFTRHWMDGLTLSSSREERLEYAEAIRTFSGLFTMEFRRGDRIRFVYQPDQSRIAVTVNGVDVGSLDDIGFFAFLLEAWIGDTPVSNTLKDGILGADEHSARQMKQAFLELQYGQDRRQRVAEYLGSPVRESGTSIGEPESPAGEGETSIDEPATEASPVTAPPLLNEAARLAAELEAARQEAERLEAEQREAARLEAERLEREAREEAEARRIAEEKRQHEQQQQRLGIEYRDRLIAWIRQFAEYPPRAMQRRQEGRIEMSVTTNRQGQITESAILEASGSYLLDNAANDMLDKAAPLPVMPEELEGDSFTFIMPISFAL